MVTTEELILVSIAAVIGIGAGFIWGQQRNSKNKSAKSLPKNHSQTAAATVQKAKSLPAGIKNEKVVQGLIDDGHKIGALKELRDSTHLELEDAKNIIDSLPTSIQTTNLDQLAKVRDLIQNGEKQEALKLYSESLGVSLKDSQEAIDKMEKEFGSTSKPSQN